MSKEAGLWMESVLAPATAVEKVDNAIQLDNTILLSQMYLHDNVLSCG